LKNFQTIPASSLQDVFGKKTYLRGQQYFLHHKVINLDTRTETANTIILDATVAGSNNQRYNQIIAINKTGHNLHVNGKCSCPVGYNCKHVVAACLVYQQAKPQLKATSNEAYINWLSSFDQVDTKSGTSKEYLVYVLQKSNDGRDFLLSLLIVRNKKQGGITAGRNFSLHHLRYGYFSGEHYPSEDRDILRLVTGADSDHHDNVKIKGALGYLILNKALQFGRLFWNSHQLTQPLCSGESRPLQLSWATQKDGAYTLTATVPNHAILLPTEPPMYLDMDSSILGTVDYADMTYQQFQKVLAAPPVPAEYAEDLSLRLLTEHPELPLPLPKPIEVTELNGLSPQPRLQLLGRQLDDGRYVHLLKLAFEYGGHTLSGLRARSASTIKTKQGFIKIQRNPDHENGAVQALLAFGFRQFEFNDEQELFFYSPSENTEMDSMVRWAQFIDDEMPVLIQQGWTIGTDDSFLLQFQQPQHWDTDIQQSGNGWFNMQFNVTVNNRSLPLLPLITPVLEQYHRDHLPKKLSVPLGQHEYINIDAKQLKPFLDILYELFDSLRINHNGGARISRYNAAALVGLEQHNHGLFSIQGGQALIELGKKIRNFKGITDTPPPVGLCTQLREYQQKGLNWLQFLREYRFGGILADDMGLGKTVQTLAHLLLEKESGRMDKPCLIVAPTSLMSNWRREVQRFTPDLSVLILQGSDRKQRFGEIKQHDLVLTTYPLLHRDKQILLANTFYYLILDEAQVVKNPHAQASQMVRRIEASHRLCLTGTPMENHLGELWAQFDFLMPGFLDDYAWFKKNYRTPIESHANIEKKDKLSKRLRPFMLRRTKPDVADELPEKNEIIRTIPLHAKQAALYESIRVSMEKQVRDAIAEKGLARSYITILDALLKLRQTCCDPRTLNLKQGQKIKQSAKLDLLMDMLPELLEEGRRILVFSQFTRMLALIEAELKSRAIGYCKLTGQTRKRDEAIELFKNGHANVFLISLKAGGVGLNLTEADTVIIYDPWWNPAVENQAADRAHRIGQDKTVFVYKLITENTVEEKILALQEKKRALAESVYHDSNNSQTLKLNANDLADLFQPLEN